MHLGVESRGHSYGTGSKKLVPGKLRATLPCCQVGGSHSWTKTTLKCQDRCLWAVPRLVPMVDEEIAIAVLTPGQQVQALDAGANVGPKVEPATFMTLKPSGGRAKRYTRTFF